MTESTQMEKRLLELEGKMDTLREEISKVRLAGRTMYLDYVKVRWGVAPGVIVTYDGKQFRLVFVGGTSCFSAYSLSHRPWIKVNPKKKDGTWGIAVRTIYGDWEIAK